MQPTAGCTFSEDFAARRAGVGYVFLSPRTYPLARQSAEVLMSIFPRLTPFGVALGALVVCAASALPIFAADALWLDAARASITTSELHSHAGFLADDVLEGREAGSRGSHAAARYIVGRLESTGLTPAGANGGFLQSFPGNSQNILAVLPGTDPDLADEYILVGAHYDHVGYGTRRNSYGPVGFIHNGADDNASGVATLLEVIDALAHVDHRPRRSILFAFWDGEEKGLLGSQYWRRHATVPLESIKVAWNIDMVGRMENGRIELLGARSAAGMRQLLASPSLNESWIDFTWDYKDNSDHWTFYQAGIPSLCLHTGLHDDYHRPSDDIEKLNIEGMRLVGHYFLEQLCEMADADKLPAFRPQSRFETPSTQKRVERPLANVPPRVDFTWQYEATGRPAAVVDQVPRGSRAELAGLRLGDRVVAANGVQLTAENTLPALVLRSEEKLALAVERGGEQVNVDVPLAGERIVLGMSWREDAAEPGTVYITRVVPHSPADVADVKLFDRIYALEGEPIAGQADFLSRVQALLAAQATTLRLQIESRGQVREAIVSLAVPTQSAGDISL